MSLESALERYPKTVTFKNGLSVTLRPLVESDYDGLSDFLKSLPNEDLMFLKERISDPKVIRRWCKNIDPHQTLHLLALAGKQVVGLVSMSQDSGGWKRHIGRINVHTLPKFRGQGIGRNLVNEMIDVSRQSGLTWLEAELFDKQQGAIRMLGLLGFSHVLRLPDYVKDMQSVTHDYVLMNMKLITEEEYAGMG
jgi:ribosomal protein S18 acetylase RimI-like enzyme